jgi:perosamine synthetase
MFDQLIHFIRDLYAQPTGVIPLHAPRFEGKEREYVLDAIDSTYVSSVGRYVDQLEEKIAAYTGAGYAVATVNGTSALHACLVLAGAEPGEEVITQSLSFVATCNAIKYSGANPVFVDVDTDTLGMSPDSLAEYLDKHCRVSDDGLCKNIKTGQTVRACVPMHTFGHPVRIDEIRKKCDQYNIILVEDAAESLGSLYKNTHTGLFGHLGVLSFNGNKIITTGGGGMIITNDQFLAHRAKHITTTAKTSHPWEFIHDQVGYNYRMPNLNAALGCAQVEALPGYVEKKRELAARYKKWFEDKEYKFITEPAISRSNYWLNSFLAKDRTQRDEILEYTNKNKVMTRPAWTPMHLLDMYKDCFRMDLSSTQWISDRLINLPSSVPE